jgi:hypothetical protein
MMELEVLSTSLVEWPLQLVKQYRIAAAVQYC